MAKTLTIVEEDRVGLLMDISYIMGKEKINIESISAVSVGGKAIFSLMVKDVKKAAEVLKKNGFNVLETDTLMIKIKDEPGALAKIAKLMADNGINMTTMYVVSRDGDTMVIAFTADKARKAKELLKDYLI